MVPDNLKSTVISNFKKGIIINESYAELSRQALKNSVGEPLNGESYKSLIEQGEKQYNVGY